MSKHSRIPGPLPRLNPSVIRSVGPRLVLLFSAGCAALLVIGGSSYLLSHVTGRQPAPSARVPALNQSPAPAGKVLGTATSSGTSLRTSPPKPINKPATTYSSATSAVTPAYLPVPSVSIVRPSFTINIDTANIVRQLSGAYVVPFTITRHGNLTTPIVPGPIAISGGNAFLTIQSETMLGPDNGTLVLLPVNLLPSDRTVTFTASSGDKSANTTFTYRFGL